MFQVCIENDQLKLLDYLLSLNKLSLLHPLMKDSANNTVLHLACKQKKHASFALIVDRMMRSNEENKVDYDANDEQEETTKKKSKIISATIELINSQNQSDESVFAVACKLGSLEIVEYLLKLHRSAPAAYDPLNDRDDQYGTPLHSAAHTKHMRIIELLIENGADVNAQDKLDRIPLHYCCEMGLFEISKLLVEHKSKVCVDIDIWKSFF